MQDDGKDDRERAEERDRVRDVRSRDRNDADAREVGRKAADRVRRQDSLRDAAVERQCPDRDRERRQADPGHEEPVERAEERAEDDGHDHRRPDRPAVLEELGHQDSGQAEHRGDRQVDLSCDDEQGERQRHDRDLADVQADEEQVARLQEVRGDGRAVRDRAAEQHEEKRLPARDDAEAEPRRGPATRHLVPGLEVVELSHGLSVACARRARRAVQSAGRTRSQRRAERPRRPDSRRTTRSRRRARC